MGVRGSIETWAPWMQALYHVYWAAEGDFNADTRQFTDFVRHWANGLDKARFVRQMSIAVTQPASLIGRRMRAIEHGLDPDWRLTGTEPGGPKTYWGFLYGPYYYTLMGQGPRWRDACIGAYEKQAMEYRVALLQNPSTTGDFGSWLARWRSCNPITP